MLLISSIKIAYEFFFFLFAYEIGQFWHIVLQIKPNVQGNSM